LDVIHYILALFLLEAAPNLEKKYYVL